MYHFNRWLHCNKYLILSYLILSYILNFKTRSRHTYVSNSFSLHMVASIISEWRQ